MTVIARWRSFSLILVALLAGWGPLLLTRQAAGAQSAEADERACRTAPAFGQPEKCAELKSLGCKDCHTYNAEEEKQGYYNGGLVDSSSMHGFPTVQLGCTDCHGGDATVTRPSSVLKGTPPYDDLEEAAHIVVPRAELHYSSEPKHYVRLYTTWMKRSSQYIRFINPGDLRVQEQTCGQAGCHIEEMQRVRTSMMTHGAMLYAAALYNNGAYPSKDAHFGQSYTADGLPQQLRTFPRPANPEEARKNKGILLSLDPLPRWEVTKPGNVLRVFERGGRKRADLGIPDPQEEPGRPDAKLSDRGFGTLVRTDPVFLGLQKTRLYDPLLSFPGTNDHPGDYRGSGCSGCHVIYANDGDKEHSGPYSGNSGLTASKDQAISHDQPGHPIKHVLTRIIPSSQCMVCHIHPGTNMVATYFGYTWWDNEVDGKSMYPPEQKNPSQQEYREAHLKNPEGSAAKGLWLDDNFLRNTGSADFNEKLDKTQFGDFHGHGWVFRKVFKQDRKGNLLDQNDNPISFDLPSEERFRNAVPLKDIHLENGMHCIDCHFNQDAHGNGNLYGETRNAIEITCVDCHGTVQSYATLITSGPASPKNGTNLLATRTPWKEPRFFKQDGKIFQRSSTDHTMPPWEVIQVKDVVTPGSSTYNEKGAAAMALLKTGQKWDGTSAGAQFAHPDEKMTCVACHSSWTTTCFGCHLPMTANQRMPMLQNEGTITRNYTEYDFQVLRNDMYMLGIDGTVTGHKISPVRSACAVIVSSQNQNRDWLYYGQQTISAEGFSGQAFSPYVPHTVRCKETRGCTDCHVSSENNNNAWMAQLLVQGTNFLNYLGRFAYVAMGDKGFTAVAFAERQEPEAVIGSDLHLIAYKDNFQRHIGANNFQLKEAYHHPGKNVLDVQLRGEYLYAAMGKGGLRIYDVADIENKDFSQRMITAPVSPLGQKFFVPTCYAAAIAAPSTTALDPTRPHHPKNEEVSIHPMYGYLYVADTQEGLVVVGNGQERNKLPKKGCPQDGQASGETASNQASDMGANKQGSGRPTGVSTLLDGEPRNNFLGRALAFNPNGRLNGARRITIAGVYAYILCDAGLVVVSLNNPLAPEIVAEIGKKELKEPKGLAIQFRYAFVVDQEGLKVLDVTRLDRPKMVNDATLKSEELAGAYNITVSRTYAYVAAGKHGIVVVDVERPEKPSQVAVFNGDGKLRDTRDIKVGMVSSSQFALVADGYYGFKVIQLFSPQTTPGFYGFSPQLTFTPQHTPKVIAEFQTSGPALAVSRGVDRDRGVDESGNQLSVFGRRGSRPFNLPEMQRLFLCTDTMIKNSLCSEGEVYTVTDDPKHPVEYGGKKALTQSFP